MFLNKRWEQASVALSKAGRNREVKICDAYLLREKARLIFTTAGEVRVRAFVTAAEAFITCARDSTLEEVDERLAHERLAYYRTAGECYSEARDLKSAGDNYCIAGEYTEAARAYREGGYFDEMVEVINRHRDVMNGGLIERLEADAKVHYFKVYSNNRTAAKYV